MILAAWFIGIALIYAKENMSLIEKFHRLFKTSIRLILKKMKKSRKPLLFLLKTLKKTSTKIKVCYCLAANTLLLLL